jgi:16S rRNA (adenine1518-N6/adenine1519-N6)-dimethyltransferase
VGRRLGQHFLFDPTILDRIVDALEPTPDDVVLEIGPGRGTLTRRLVPRVSRVVAIEADPALAARLERESALGDALTLMSGDALTVDWHRLVHDAGAKRFKVVGNIPYYITSPLIDRALRPPLPQAVVFLLQREVADRLAAKPGSKVYGALTVGVQAAATVERLFVVPAGAFRPPPKVESAVVRLVPLDRPLIAPVEHPAFRAFVQSLFSRRRKQLANALRLATGMERDRTSQALVELGISPTARPEQVSVERIAALFRQLGPSVEPEPGPQVDSGA